VKVLVTGGRSGIGAAIVEALANAEVTVLDLVDGHDVGRVDTWRALDGPFDAAFLNAGVTTGSTAISQLTDDRYRRIMGVNVDGVVLGVRELAARLMPHGGSIVATASLAGLTGSPVDPVYALTKHAVVGFVRSVAPQLAERGIRINALCPAFTDTPLVVDELRGELPVQLIEPSFVAQAALQALNDDETGRAWVVQLNRIVPFRYPGVPGPR
jgi:NAD(P)-dependent dehydrogenase (short-subunit alcohol dehydrogenase family)